MWHWAITWEREETSGYILKIPSENDVDWNVEQSDYMPLLFGYHD